ncbi:MAG: site-specific DNA-methyltransferase [Candidatus Lambdaproteobacteria bacterium]|nr:site-specific DNA-methyltransferase [Candidatus Lambdaproteobacteria bacterium]
MRMEAPVLVFNEVYHMDCRVGLEKVRDDAVQLIVTSPPYADSRKRSYGGVAPDQYVEWFLPIAAQLRRVLRPDGTFILNIKEKVVGGERHPYVLELILALRREGWLWTEEFIWHKKNSFPGKWPNRFRDSWERCLQFNRRREFYMDQDAVRVPMGDWARQRLRRLSTTDRLRDNSHVGSGFGKRVANWVGRTLAYPTNVLHLATETGNRGHSAAFPRALPNWFIRLFSRPGDRVLDPFMGVGTTALVAQELGREFLGFETDGEYCALAKAQLAQEAHALARRRA